MSPPHVGHPSGGVIGTRPHPTTPLQPATPPCHPIFYSPAFHQTACYVTFRGMGGAVSNPVCWVRVRDGAAPFIPPRQPRKGGGQSTCLHGPPVIPPPYVAHGPGRSRGVTHSNGVGAGLSGQTPGASSERTSPRGGGATQLVQSTTQRVRRWTPQAGHGSTGSRVCPLLAGFVT